jgi:predicted Ser/Thr protein kinase
MDGMTQILRSRLSPGTRLNGIYEVDNLIASGGMGEVYKGHTIQTGDPVAIKVLLPNFAGNDAALGLFRREASALHNLQHEAIVRYYVFTIEPVLRRPYLAMEFVEGRSLAEIVRNEPLPYEAVRSLLKRLATGLHAAHERGITHRDVSSDNIMIPGGDVARAKIIDFGIARSTLLQEHTIIGGGFAGKYNYVSPEQLGLFGGDVRAKSDIYSLGLVLVEALTGQPIDMGGTQAAVLDKRRKVPDLGAIDLRIRPLLEKMLQPDPAARPDSMMQVATWPLPTSHAGDRRASDADNGRAKRSHASARGRGKWYASAAVLAALMLGGAAAAYLYPRASGPQTRPPATPETATKLPAPAEKKLAAPSDPPAPALTPAQPIVAPPAAAKQPAALDTTALLTPPSSPAPTLTPAQPAVAPPALTPAKPAAPPTAAPKQPGAVDIAALPPSTALGPASQIERYIGQYNGGDCFFITPNAISANAARIDGYGTDQAAFQVLDEAFKRANGFEADIEVRQVTAQQCPALTFLSRMRGERSRALHLQIGETNLKSGEALTGSIEGVGSDSVQLLLVSDEGTVQDLSTFLKPAGDGRTFNLRMQRVGASGAQPQLLLAVASARPLETLRDAKASADQLFPLARVEVSRAGQAAGATMRYFKLDR